MRFVCESCNHSFCTLDDEENRKKAFYGVVEGLRCPHCGSSIYHLHPYCAGRIVRTKAGGFSVECEGCESFFQCWTGNTAQGVETEGEEESDREAEMKRAQYMLDQAEIREARSWSGKLFKQGVRIGKRPEVKSKNYYLKLGSTWYKLYDDDLKAIIWGTFDTPTTKNIESHTDKLDMISNLLRIKLKYDKDERTRSRILYVDIP